MQEAWLRSQSETVYVFGDREYAEDEVPDDVDPGDGGPWYGCRAWRDLEGFDPTDCDPVGFAYEFQ